jgi:hypothetical protein
MNDMIGFPMSHRIRLPEAMYKYYRDFIERIVSASGK